MKRASTVKTANRQFDRLDPVLSPKNVPPKNTALRTAIHAVLAASAIAIATTQRAEASCNDFGNFYFCSGNVSGGIYTDDFRLNVVVTNLSTPIAPAQGTRGVNFFRDDEPEMPLTFFWDGSQ
jgi:hypothetical protein